MKQYGCYGYDFNCQYVDLDGNPVQRTKDEYRYSYDPYVVYKNGYNMGKGSVVYSDRLLQWDYKKHNECCQRIWGNEGQMFDNRSPEDIEKFLSLYFDKQIKLTAIMEGCNVSNGYPYWIFFFEDKPINI